VRELQAIGSENRIHVGFSKRPQFNYNAEKVSEEAGLWGQRLPFLERRQNAQPTSLLGVNVSMSSLFYFLRERWKSGLL
jgi:hypothetical protein